MDKICCDITALLPASVGWLARTDLLFHLILKIIGNRMRVANHVLLDIRYETGPRIPVDCGGEV